MAGPYPRRHCRAGAGRRPALSRSIRRGHQLSAAARHRGQIAMAVRFVATLAVVVLTLFAVVPAQAEVVFQDVTSPKGINAWLVEDYSVPLVTIRFSFAGGTSQDP